MMCAVCGCGTGAATIAGNVGNGHHHHSQAGDHHHHGDDDHPHDHGHPHHHGHDPAAGHEHHHGYDHAAGHEHHHGHDEPMHAHAPGLDGRRMVEIERSILAKNDGFAAENRDRFAATGVVAVNLLAGPGAGKTTLLVATIRALAGRVPLLVVEGDQQTSNDADRIRAAGAPAVQINTGKGCHLDAHMVGHAIDALPLAPGALVVVENVGNLVCPAAFDLGEDRRVTLVSVTEGEDKPLKYPDIFAGADAVVVTKIDLAPHVDADLALLRANIARVNPRAELFAVSARTGEGLDTWLDWLGAARAERLARLAAEAEARAAVLRSAAATERRP
jgi:hydrogenase nickel incorporation protein HypB